MTTIIGNLFPIIEAIADINPPSYSFLAPQFTDAGAWSLAARAKLLELLRYQPATVPFRPEVVEVADMGDYIREKLYFSTSASVRVPAYVLRPTHITAPAPGIVALHDHGGFYTYGKEKLVQVDHEPAELLEHKCTYYSCGSYASELARRGYVVIVIDAFYFGERRINFNSIDPTFRQRLQARSSTQVEQLSEYHTQCSVFEEVVARHIFAAGATWLGIMSHDDRATVNYLSTRPEVDPTRIGCLGLSMGGHRTNYLTATDPRIKAAVSVGWMTNWRDMLSNHIGSHSWSQFVPGLASRFELSDVVSIGMPVAFYAQECIQDELFPVAGMQQACNKIAAVYAKAGIPDRFQSSFYDVPHQFNATMQQDAFSWLDRWLK